MKILIIDDHQLFMDGLRYVLEKIADDVDVHTEINAENALGRIQQSWDLILVDISMPKLDGFTLLKKIRKVNQHTKVVIISSSEESADIEMAKNLKANGFLSKAYDEHKIITKINSVISGVNEFLPQAPKININESQREIKAKLKALGITRKQYEILNLLEQGYTNNKIAEHQGISLHTVKSHLAELFRLLDVNNRTQCVAEARRIKLL